MVFTDSRKLNSGLQIGIETKIRTVAVFIILLK